MKLLSFLSRNNIRVLFFLGLGLLALIILYSFKFFLGSVSAESNQNNWNGVPSLGVNYNQNVKEWWDAHPFNSKSPNYKPGIDSPAYQVNVLSEYNGDIQAAIDSLPQDGGTLILPEASYSGTFRLVDRDNVHFIGIGKPVIYLSESAVVSGCEMATVYAAISDKVAKKDPIALECVTSGRSKNIYFKNLTFDGRGVLEDGIDISASRDMVFDYITFKNFKDPKTHHQGLVSGNAVLDNIWFRDCNFLGDERYALYLDGLHGGGVIDSTVNGKFGSGGFLFLTNDDLSRDYDNSGSIDISEQRTANHFGPPLLLPLSLILWSSQRIRWV